MSRAVGVTKPNESPKSEGRNSLWAAAELGGRLALPGPVG